MKISSFLRIYATRLALLVAIVAFSLFIPASLTTSQAVRVFLIILILLCLSCGAALLFWGNQGQGGKLHYFLYDRRRARVRRRDELNADVVQDAMSAYLQPFAKDPLSLWNKLPRPLLLQLDAQEQFCPLVTYHLLYVLSTCDGERICEVFDRADKATLTYLCHAIAQAGDSEMADFIYHLWQSCKGKEEKIVSFFQKNKQRFAARALRLVERDFDLFYVPKSFLIK